MSSGPRACENGFTMLELTTVGLIIMMLIAIALPNFLEAQIRAKVTKAMGEMSLVAGALEEYYVNYRAYPPNLVPTLEEGGLSGDGETGKRGTALVPLTTPASYLSILPTDPFSESAVSPKDALFDYVNFVDLTGSTISKNTFGFPGNAAYIVAGVGPDGYPDLKAGTLPPSCVGYSPTNGTKSIGDQMILGP